MARREIDYQHFKSTTNISNLPPTFFYLHDIEIFLAGILIIKLTKRRYINRNGIGSVRVCPDDLIRRGAGRGQYCYEVDR